RRALLRALTVAAFVLVVVALGFAYPALARGDELVRARYEGRYFLVGLLLVPLLLWRGTWGEDRRIPRLRLGTLSPIASGPSGVRVWLRDLPGAVRAVAFGLLALALARAVARARRAAARAGWRDFTARRESDGVGVVVFGQSAYVLSPPTLDYHLLAALVGRMELNLIDPGGTAIGDAVGVAVARLRKS